MRKVITLTARLCESHNISTWRQHAYTIKQLKRLMRVAQKKKRSGGQPLEHKEKRQVQIAEAHQAYLDLSEKYRDRACNTLENLKKAGILSTVESIVELEIQEYIAHADRQIDQIRRCVVQGESIAHQEKVFSIFEPHTECISKGKAGVPVELGLRVCVLEDQYQFLLHYQVMEKQTDDQVAGDRQI